MRINPVQFCANIEKDYNSTPNKNKGVCLDMHSKYNTPPLALNTKDNERLTFSLIKELKKQNSDTYEQIASFKEKIPYIDSSFPVLLQFAKGKISLDKFLTMLSKLNISSTLIGVKKEEIDKIQNKLSAGGIDSSYCEMMLELIQDRKLNPGTIVQKSKKAKLQKNFIKDIDSVYRIKNNKTLIEKTFVPYYESKKEAIQKLHPGDVCIIKNNEKISIKTSKDSLEELFISPKTYLKLFAPMQKFALMQGSNGDCFLLSTLYSLYNNPFSRHIILKMFKENNDGTIDSCICGYKKEDNGVAKKYKNDFELQDILNKFKKEYKNNKKYYANQFEAMKLLEFLYRQYIEKQAEKEIVKYYKKSLNADNLETPAIERKEMELFLNILGRIDNEEELFNKTLSFNQKIEIKELQQLQNKLAYLRTQPYSELGEYLSLILKRNIDYSVKNNLSCCNLAGIIPKECFNSLVDEVETDYLDGGCSYEVFDNLKIQNNVFFDDENNELLDDILSLKTFNSYFVATATANKENKRYDIISGHSYIIFKDNNDKFAIINPHNVSNKVVVNKDKLKDLFSAIVIAKFN